MSRIRSRRGAPPPLDVALPALEEVRPAAGPELDLEAGELPLRAPGGVRPSPPPLQLEAPPPPSPEALDALSVAAGRLAADPATPPATRDMMVAVRTLLRLREELEASRRSEIRP